MLTTHPFDDDKLREECGVFGIWGADTAAAVTALGLHALQHRGQEAAGITSWDGHAFHSHRAMGHVAGNFDKDSVIRALAGTLRIPISIDTYKAEVAREALAEGAAIVNDVSGLQYDAALGGVVAAAGAGLVLMHMRGRSETMYADAHYDDLMADLGVEIDEAIARAVSSGVPRHALIVDPGIGFAKRQAHSYGVLARLAEVSAAIRRPVLAGPSRKSFMKEALGGRAAPERDWGTAAAVTAAVLAGAHIVRVHAVAEMVQVVRVAENIRRHGGPQVSEADEL